MSYLPYSAQTTENLRCPLWQLNMFFTWLSKGRQRKATVSMIKEFSQKCQVESFKREFLVTHVYRKLFTLFKIYPLIQVNYISKHKFRKTQFDVQSCNLSFIHSRTLLIKNNILFETKDDKTGNVFMRLIRDFYHT